MACGGCKKRKKAFAHRVAKVKANGSKVVNTKKEISAVLQTPPAPKLQEVTQVSPNKKKKRQRLSKRALWLRQKRKEERRLQKEKKL